MLKLTCKQKQYAMKGSAVSRHNFTMCLKIPYYIIRSTFLIKLETMKYVKTHSRSIRLQSCIYFESGLGVDTYTLDKLVLFVC